jgi:hypothetical protein
MGKIRGQPPVKLIAGFIFSESEFLKKAKGILQKTFGQIDFESQILAFSHTAYYEKEFGKNLKRNFVSFKKLIPPRELPQIKITTNKIEEKLSDNGLRLINIDPGYLDLSKLVLASTKDYKHRVYLNKGIFAEVTLFYQNKTFNSWEWTYPDYKTQEYREIFKRIRDIYAGQIKNK